MKLTATVCALLLGVVAHAQHLAGTRFDLAIPVNFRPANWNGPKNNFPHRQQLSLAATSPATVRVLARRTEFDTTVTVPANSVVNVLLPSGSEVERDSIVQQATVSISSDVPIVACYLDNKYQTTDAMLLWPNDRLGTSYRLVSVNKLSNDLLPSATITATELGTTVTIIPTVDLAIGARAGMPHTVKLDRGQCLYLEPFNAPAGTLDLSGTLITSNKPVNVITGHACAYVPAKVEACNMLIEQAPPTTTWGQRFIVPTIAGRAAHTWRMVAHEACSVVVDTTTYTLNAGQMVELTNQRRASLVEASAPILIGQFGHGFKSGDSTGDPILLIIPPRSAWSLDHIIPVPDTKDWSVHCTVLGTQGALRSTTVNGTAINEADIVSVGELAYAHVRVNTDRVLVRASMPVGTILSAVGVKSNIYDAYGLTGGWRTP